MVKEREGRAPVGRLWPGEFVFCPMCGERLTERDVQSKPRMVCPKCEFVHFRNPGVGAAVLMRDDRGRVLLVRRAEGASCAGLWSIPAGYVDYGEEIRAAAAREVQEETGLEVEVGDVVNVTSNFHDPAKLTVGVWFVGEVTGGSLEAGDDADAVGYFDLDDLPELAFDTDRDLFMRLRLGEG